MSGKREQGATRRDFFKKAGAGVGAVGAAAIVLRAGSAEAGAPAIDGRGGKGYHKTEHVRTYYESAKF